MLKIFSKIEPQIKSSDGEWLFHADVEDLDSVEDPKPCYGSRVKHVYNQLSKAG